MVTFDRFAHRLAKGEKEAFQGFRLDRRSVLASGLLGSLAAISPALAKPANFFAAHGLDIGAQLYTLGDHVAEDLEGSFDRLAAIGFRSIQLSGLHGHTVRELRAAADASGLSITSIHLGDEDLGASVEDTRRLAGDLAVLGTREIALRMFPFPEDVVRQQGEHFIAYLQRVFDELGADIWKRTADLLNRRAQALHEEGLMLGYHNHNCEFAPVDGTTGWDILVEGTDPSLVSFEVDVGWVAAAGRDPVEVVSRLAGRTRLMHVKDISEKTEPNFAFSQVSTEIGSGIIDWNALLPAAYRAGVRHFYVEQEPPFAQGRFEALAKGYAFLSR